MSDGSNIDRSENSGNVLARFGGWLSVWRNFLLYATFGFGGLSYLGLLLFLGIWQGMGDAPLWILAAPLCLVAGYVWGLFMWQFFQYKRVQWKSRGNSDA